MGPLLLDLLRISTTVRGVRANSQNHTAHYPSKPPPPNAMSFDLSLKATPEQQKERFVQSLKQALIANKYSQRELCEALGITIGTLTKYLRGAVNPNNVGVSKIRALAKELGITTNSLLDYYDTGEYRSTLTIDDVASWIRSSAGQEDLPQLLAAASEASMRTSNASVNWPGYTDEEAKSWCQSMHETLEELSRKTGKSIRGAWRIVEAEIDSLGGVTEEEVDLCYDVASGGRVFSGLELTDARRIFLGRFAVPCPLVMALSKIEVLENSAHLSFCREMCERAGDSLLAA